MITRSLHVVRKIIKFTVVSLSVGTVCIVGGIILSDDPTELKENQQPQTIVNDVTGMNPIPVAQVVIPTSIEQVQSLVRNSAGPISVGGGHYSMGGQTASEGTLHLDMRGMDRVISLDQLRHEVTVEAGITWHKLQEALDPYNLSVQIMQSYSNFTVGGSLSVNVHGRYIGHGPIVGSVHALKIVLPDGSLVTASREENAEIFSGCIGGYSALGVIVEATLGLDDNVAVKRLVKRTTVEQYPQFFRSSIRDNSEVIFQNGDLLPPTYKDIYSVAWVKTNLPVTEQRRLSEPTASPSFIERTLSTIFFDIPYGIHLRPLIEPLRYRHDVVEWRNFEASYNVSDLAPISTQDWSYVLQEYFVPVDHFVSFVESMRSIFKSYAPRMMNVSIRHAIPDEITTMSWSQKEVFAFVLYYRQGTDIDSRREVGEWTRALVDASLKEGGTYYLPYQPHARRDQFMQAYPRAKEFFTLKQKIDPQYKFRNKLWDAYYQPDLTRKILETTISRPEYFRPEEQTYLTVPEWELVFASEALARTTGHASQDHFAFFGSLYDFWRNFCTLAKVSIKHYPANWGYHFMNYVIGVHTSIEYAIKGVYENVIGRFTAWWGNAQYAPAQGSMDSFIHATYTAYALFIHDHAWYEFNFFERYHQMVALVRPEHTSLLRHYERKVSFGVELLLKGFLGELFAVATGNIYGTETNQIEAVMSLPSGSHPDFIKRGKVISTIDSSHILLSFPRYEAFTQTVIALAADPDEINATFSEIAGNKVIALSVIVPEEMQLSASGITILDEAKLRDNERDKRLICSVEVIKLLDVLRQFKAQSVTVEHVFDY